MSRFFSSLLTEGKLEEWASILDWLLNEERFSGWLPEDVQRFTKKAKKLPGLGHDTWIEKAAQNINPKNHEDKRIFVQFRKGDSSGRGLLTHIRNGIAHGNCTIFKIGGDLHIEITDYGKDKAQTAFMKFPIEYISMLHETYNSIEKNLSDLGVTKKRHPKKKAS